MWSIAETEKGTGLTWKQLQVKTLLFVNPLVAIDMQSIQKLKAVIIKLTLHWDKCRCFHWCLFATRKPQHELNIYLKIWKWKIIIIIILRMIWIIISNKICNNILPHFSIKLSKTTQTHRSSIYLKKVQKLVWQLLSMITFFISIL